MKDYQVIFRNENRLLFQQLEQVDLQIEIGRKNTLPIFWFITIVGSLLTLYLTLGFDFLGFTVPSIHNAFGGSVIETLIALFLGSIISSGTGWLGKFISEQGVNKHEYAQRKQILKALDEKATQFATTVYLQDLIAALKSAFVLSPDFESKLKAIMQESYWLNGIERDQDDDDDDDDDDSDDDSDDYDDSDEDQDEDEDEDEQIDFDPQGLTLDYMSYKQRLSMTQSGVTYLLTEWTHHTNLPFVFTCHRIISNGQMEKDIQFHLPVSK